MRPSESRRPFEIALAVLGPSEQTTFFYFPEGFSMRRFLPSFSEIVFLMTRPCAPPLYLYHQQEPPR